jgi:hypothetical protein
MDFRHACPSIEFPKSKSCAIANNQYEIFEVVEIYKRPYTLE